MSQNKIPDFTETELWAVRSTLKERYGKEVEPQLADTEVMLGGAEGMAWCPALFWKPHAQAENQHGSTTGAVR